MQRYFDLRDATRPPPEIEDEDEQATYNAEAYTLCLDCQAQFYPGECGFGDEECFECGGYTDTYE